MTTSLKKLLLISITLLLGMISGGVMAQTYTNYDFTETNDGTYGDNFVFTGTVQVDTSKSTNNVVGITNWNFVGHQNNLATSDASGTVNLATKEYAFDFYFYYPGPSPSGLSAASILSVANSSIYGPSINYGDYYSSSLTPSGPGGAPEIDGSLAPKIALLLGCSYLMFGGKKQNSEPMMTA